MNGNQAPYGARAKLALMLSGTGFLIILSILAIVATFTTLNMSKSYWPSNTINVSGQGEVDVSPDIAVISFTVEEEAKDSGDAEVSVTNKVEKILGDLESLKIDEKDIKTQNFSVQPKYEYVNVNYTEGYYPNRNTEQVGFIVSQYVTVKVRDIDSAGDVISAINKRGVKYVNGPDFQVDDMDAAREEARKLAIKDAKEKAQILADELGVKLGKLINYSEGGMYPYAYAEMASSSMVAEDMGMGMMKSAILPTGVNTITSDVSLVYELK